MAAHDIVDVAGHVVLMMLLLPRTPHLLPVAVGELHLPEQTDHPHSLVLWMGNFLGCVVDAKAW